jgi:hypothetical protein
VLLQRKSVIAERICSGEHERVRVDISSPSFKECQQRLSYHPRSSDTYPFDLCQLFPCIEIRQEGIFSQGCRKNATALVERNAAAGVDWLDGVFRLKRRLVRCLVCHCARYTRAAEAAGRSGWVLMLLFIERWRKKCLEATGVLDKLKLILACFIGSLSLGIVLQLQPSTSPVYALFNNLP